MKNKLNLETDTIVAIVMFLHTIALLILILTGVIN